MGDHARPRLGERLAVTTGTVVTAIDEKAKQQLGCKEEHDNNTERIGPAFVAEGLISLMPTVTAQLVSAGAVITLR